MSKLTKVLTLLAITLFTMGNTSCEGKESTRAENTRARESNMERANAAVPVPTITNFAAREAVAKQVKRMDQKGKLYYIYLVTETGAQLGYYVSNTRPINVCSALTPVDDVNKYGANDAVGVTRAPGLQGTYGGCNDQNSFIFDAVTDAYIEFPNSKVGTITDMPLALDSKPIRYQQVPAK